MAQNPKKPAGKRRPTPKVAGHTRGAARPDADQATTDSGVSASPLPEVRGA